MKTDTIVTDTATAESIARAKADCYAERAQIEQATGIRITEEGRFTHAPAVVVHCPRPQCGFVASARTEGGAIRGIAAHLVRVHLEQGR